MSISGLIKLAFSLRWKTKHLFLLEFFMTVLSMLLISYAVFNFFSIYGEIITVNSFLSSKPECTYHVCYDVRGSFDEISSRRITDFYLRLSTDDTFLASGAYFREEKRFFNKDEAYTFNTLIVEPSLLNIHELKDEYGEIIKKLDENNVIVGSNVGFLMPNGSNWQDDNGLDFEVAHVLSKGECWFSDIMLGDDYSTLLLDDFIIVPLQGKLLEQEIQTDNYFGYCLQNGTYYVAKEEEKQTAENKIIEISEISDCPVTVISIRKMIEDYIRSYRQLYLKTNFMTGLMVILSVVGLYMTAHIFILKQRENLRIMQVYGIDAREQKRMLVLERTVMFVLSCLIAWLCDIRIKDEIAWNSESHILAAGITAGTITLLCELIVEILSEQSLMIILREDSNGESDV